jgi:filamentous hemagglutinin
MPLLLPVNPRLSSGSRTRDGCGCPLRRCTILGVVSWLVMSVDLQGGMNLTRTSSSFSTGKGTNAQGTSSQTATAATTATAQASQTVILSQRAQISMLRSVQALQAIQAQQNAQSAARNLTLSSPGSVPNGLIACGLVPGVAGTDPANPAAPGVAGSTPVTTDANGDKSVTLGANNSLTLPPSAGGNSQITVSGLGTAGSITTGGTITSLTAGVATTIAPGSTISLPNGGTIDFAAGSAAIPSTFTTYAYPTPATSTTPAGTAPIPASWSGVGGLSQSTYASSGATTVTVTQTAPQALLTWQTFNIGQGTTLDFDQSLGGADVGNWVAINKVAANIAPSQILGSIQAPGQVYVINQNGIIFGGASQVNVGALVASSLPINDNLVKAGLLNNPDLQFLFSQLDLPAGSQGPTPAFTPQGTSSAPGTAPAPGSYTSGGVVSQVDAAGNLTMIAAAGQDGDVVVQPGAQLSSPTTPQHVGGKIALIGPNVNNGGTISSPDGQVILAAGLQANFTASSDPSLRGLDVAVGQVADPTYANGAAVSGTATNDGDIEAPRADVMMTGENVDQFGVINSSTSVALNGRVDLLANYGAEALVNSVNGFNGATGLYLTQSGEVNFGPGSLTQIQPELGSTDTVVGATLALSSQMEIQGKTIDLGANAQILAPSGTLNFDAGTWLSNDNGYAFYNTTGQVYLDAGATVDVSGSENVSESVADNIIPVQLLGTELANSPLQQNGPLRGQTVYVDIRQTGSYDGTDWIGTPLGDVSGYVNLIPHTVGELTTAGGTVNIKAGNSVVQQPASAIDVSGGWINYQGATVETTKVVSGGILYDISQATPDRVYSGIYSGFTAGSSKYNLFDNYSLATTALYQPGYIQGNSGGSLSITAPAMALDGSLAGNTVAGAQQTTPISQLSKTYAGATFLPTKLAISGVPDAASLSLVFQGNDPNSTDLTYPAYSPTPPNVLIENEAPAQSAVGAFAVDPSTGNPLPLPADRTSTVVLSPDLVNRDGFGTLSIIDSDGSITVPAGVSLSTPLGGSVSISNEGVPVLNTAGTTIPVEGGSITFNAANVTIDGSVAAPGGNLLFSVYDFSPYTLLGVGASTPPADLTRGNFVLGPEATLSTAGLVLNQSIDSAGISPLVIDGGKITIASYSTDLVAGSVVNASGGVVVNASGKQTFGTGGAISIAAGQDLDYSGLLGGHLTLGASLQAYSGGAGGSLAITAPLIQIGGSSLENGDTLATGDTLWLDPASGDNPVGPEFFNQGGFGSFTLSGLGRAVVDSQGNPIIDSSGNPEFMPALLIAPGTAIQPVAENWQVVNSGNGFYLQATTLPLPSERTSVSLNFNAKGVSDSETSLLIDRGDFVMGAGSSITTDPQTNAQNGVSIHAQTAAILGSIVAPGGTITIAGGSSFANVDNLSLLEPTVDLGPQSYLSTRGAVELTPSASGYTSGSVLPGGTITVSGNIVAEAGAVLDVSGASGVLDVTPTQAGLASTISSSLVPLRENSNGGSITLSGSSELFTDATLLGAAGGPTAVGGSLTVSSGRFLADSSVIETPLDVTLIVTQDGIDIPVPAYYPAGETAIGNPVVDAQGNPVAGLGYFAAESFDNPASGFGSLTLGGTVQFKGPVTLTAPESLTIAENLTKPSGGIIFADSQVTLTAPYVALGQTFLGPETTQQQQLPVYVDSTGNGFSVPPVFGAGNLAVNAGLIDVGNLSLQNIGQVSLTAAQGDIRGDGTLDVAGDLTVTAGQVYPVTDTTFTLAAYDHNGTAGSITIAGSGDRPLPLSAGGTLNLYASNIAQAGVLRAPIGTINLGSGVTGASPADIIGGGTFDSTQELILAFGSDTSVSAVDPSTGQALAIPYGVNLNGVQWNDPAGNNITTAGNGPNAIPDKAIVVSAANIQDQAGSLVDVSGGGDLYSYQFVTGTGGTVNTLNLPNNSYAILPSSHSTTAQASTYSPGYAADGYTTSDSSVAVGKEIYLSAGSGLPAGYYTLLPSIYALQPGAYLVTPKSGVPLAGAAQTLPDGSSLVAGYIVNGLTPPSGQSLLTSFQLDPPAVVKTLGQYNISSGNTFFAQNAVSSNIAVPRLPLDAGQLVLAAEATLAIDGSVISGVPTGGQGSLVDIASPSNILIAVAGADLSQIPNTTLVLSASGLSAFGADSLLVGGYRGQNTEAGTAVTVTTGSLTVDNAGAGNALTGPDIILVSNDDLTLDANSQVEQGSRTLTSAGQNLVLGETGAAGSGDGALLRVTSDPTAHISRLGVDPSDPALLAIGAGATISGTNLTLDSTNQSTLLSTALTGSSISIDSGLISLVLGPSGSAGTPSGLVLSNAALQSLQASATDLSLLSYSAIDIYGSGTIGGGLDSAGLYPISSLTLHAAAIRGDGGNVGINAQSIALDDSPGVAALGAGPASSTGGSLSFNAGTVQLGAAGQTGINGTNIEGYDNVTFNASGGMLLEGAGSTTSSTGTVTPGQFTLGVMGSTNGSGNLILDVPRITGATAANQTITAGGNITLNPAGNSSATVVGGLGASLDLIGQSVVDNSNIVLPSGTLQIEATTGDLVLGNQETSLLDVGGTTKLFNDLPQYTSGGRITLTSDAGSVTLASGSTVNVAAPVSGGNGGSLSVSAAQGTLTFAESTMNGQGGAGGTNGAFLLDVGTVGVSTALAGNDLTPLESALDAGGFTQAQTIRVRGGTVNGTAYDDVYLEGATSTDQAKAWNYNLSADRGSIIFDGEIDASGLTGGSIDLAASGSVTLGSHAVLTAAGQNFSDAGKGGSVTLDAGSETNGQAPIAPQGPNGTTGVFAPGAAVVDIEAGSQIDLSVGTETGTGGQTVSLATSGSSYLNFAGAASFTLPGGTPGNDVIAFSSGGTVTSGGVTTSFAAGSSLTGLASGSTIQLNGSGTVLFAGGNTAAIPVALAANTNYTQGALGDSTGTLHLRAPQLADGSDLQVDPIQGTLINPSSVVLEGYKIYNPSGGVIDAGIEGNATTSSANDGTIYGDAMGFTANTGAILTRLLGAAPTVAQSLLYQVTPGAEIVSTTGNLTLANTWDLSTFRFGPNADPATPGSGVPGILTLRAAGNLVFGYQSNASASLSDGFTGYDGSSTSSLWDATLMPGQSWSYQLTAGADFSAAGLNQVQSRAELASSGLGGSVQIGLNAPALPTDTNDTTGVVVPQYYQVIRTGTGDITISAGDDVQLLNPLAAVYSAGTQAPALAGFILPNLAYTSSILGSNLFPVYQAAYSESGGNVTISAQNNIGDYLTNSSGDLVDNSTKELPTSWLFRQGFVQNGNFAATHAGGPVAATSWWVDFSNFFEDIGALGGGNVSLVAGNDVSNIDASVPTNARMPGTSPSASALVELGGGDLLVQAGHDISGGVYYVERGQGTLDAGGSIHSNSTRAALTQTALSILNQNPADSTTWLPTTLFLGQGNFDVEAGGSLLLGPVANPFLLPQSLYNSFLNKTYFSTYAETDSVEASALTGTVTLKDNIVDQNGIYYEGAGSLASWYTNVLLNTAGTFAESEPWLKLVETGNAAFDPAEALLPPVLNATAFSSNIDIVGGLVLSPAPQGTLDLYAAGSINGFQPTTVANPTSIASVSNPIEWGYSTINLSDANPASIPGITDPLSFPSPASGHQNVTWAGTSVSLFAGFASLFNETGATDGVLQTRQALHAPGLLHANDPNPVGLYAGEGDISGITLYTGKFANVIAGQDITDVSLYVQNDHANDVTLVSAGRDLIAYDPSSLLRLAAQSSGNSLFGQNSAGGDGTLVGAPTNGDLQISGPGTLEVLAGRNLDLGVSSTGSNGVGVGITSVGNQRDPYLPFAGADVVAGAGIDGNPDYATFVARFLAPGTSESSRYLPDLGVLMGLSEADDAQIWAAFSQLPANQQDLLAVDVFYLVLRDAGRDHNLPSGLGSGNYDAGFAAIAALFPGDPGPGDISLTSREIKTENGGNISLLAPAGDLTVGFDISGNQPIDQGILTEDGGNISIFAKNSVNVGTSRIFTLNGGDEIIWSTDGNIAAGASSKTVQSAPPTRVVVDPQSADVKTDLAGLATGGGIGVLETVQGAAASDVDLIAPGGTVDAGDAGIRASGNLNIAAVRVLNAGNIQVGGKSSGVPTTSSAGLGGLAAASAAAGAANNAASEVGNRQRNQSNQSVADIPSIITVEVLGYGGG